MINKVKRRIIKIEILLLITLLLLIISKNNEELKKEIKYNLFESSINFPKVKKIFESKLGGVYFVSKKEKYRQVFNNNLKYSSVIETDQGYLYNVEESYLIPCIEEGIIIYIGKKENYGLTMIIKTKENIDIWYSNIKNINKKVYDYIEKGEYIGESNGKYFYMLYSKNNKFIKKRN